MLFHTVPSDSWVMDITVADEFLGLRDQKSLCTYMFNFEWLQSYDCVKLRVKMTIGNNNIIMNTLHERSLTTKVMIVLLIYTEVYLKRGFK
jgi:hypothetical protein